MSSAHILLSKIWSISEQSMTVPMLVGTALAGEP